MTERRSVVSKSFLFSSARQVHSWILLVFLMAIVLRCIHYFGRSSMWLDELASAFNITERSFYQLATESLDFNQVAPLGFLWLQKSATLIFGVNDHAFRFFPFLFSLAGLVLFYTISRRFLQGIFLLGAFALFGLSMAMLFYGAESKQYSGDVTAALFLVWSGLQLLDGQLKPFLVWMIPIGGFFLIFCSMPAMVIAPFVLVVVLVRLVKRKTLLKPKQFAIVALSWALACMMLAFYAKFIISTDTQQAMTDYWSRGFAPLTGVGDFLLWIPLRIHKELNFSLAWFAADILPQLGYLAWAIMLLTVPGLIFLFKKDAAFTIILLSPLVTALLLSIFRVQPLLHLPYFHQDQESRQFAFQ